MKGQASECSPHEGQQAFVVNAPRAWREALTCCRCPALCWCRAPPAAPPPHSAGVGAGGTRGVWVRALRAEAPAVPVCRVQVGAGRDCRLTAPTLYTSVALDLLTRAFWLSWMRLRVAALMGHSSGSQSSGTSTSSCGGTCGQRDARTAWPAGFPMKVAGATLAPLHRGPAPGCAPTARTWTRTPSGPTSAHGTRHAREAAGLGRRGAVHAWRGFLPRTTPCPRSHLAHGLELGHLAALVHAGVLAQAGGQHAADGLTDGS